MKKLDSIRFRGGSGKHYDFGMYDINDEPDQVPAVYLVMYRSFLYGTYNNQVLYIGQTGDLKKNMDGHPQRQCFLNRGANRLCVLIEKKEKKRARIVSDLLEKRKPPCNT